MTDPDNNGFKEDSIEGLREEYVFGMFSVAFTFVTLFSTGNIEDDSEDEEEDIGTIAFDDDMKLFGDNSDFCGMNMHIVEFNGVTFVDNCSPPDNVYAGFNSECGKAASIGELHIAQILRSYRSRFKSLIFEGPDPRADRP